ncbi:hypothetical protein [Lysobacter sp. Root690]|uniref:hypothetical protein n=1 Tax=Lysobacter sp. Root690 TaxID=1736588 RepID=UPI001F427A61|nr:hypothetical protein [Lysobacter sp. Root690]
MASLLPAAGILPATKVRTRNENRFLQMALMEAALIEVALMEVALIEAAPMRSEFMR